MNASITIRTATKEDAERIALCLESAFEPFRSQYTPEAFRDTVPDAAAIRERMASMTIYIAVLGDGEDGEIVGTIASSAQGEEGHLRGMAVRPAWQGLSVAERLLRQAVSDLSDAGCLCVTLDTTAPLRRAIRFYERNGFVLSGRITDFFGMPLYELVKSMIPSKLAQTHSTMHKITPTQGTIN